MSSAKYLYDNFNGVVVDIYTSMDAEWINYQEITTYNHYLIVAKVFSYDEENDILGLKNDDDQVFYLDSENINMFWPHNDKFNIMNSLKKTVQGGRPCGVQQNNSNNAKFNEHLKKLKEPKI